MHSDDTSRFERRILLLMAMIQFINIWDFMIVMPMGPDFAKALAIDTGHIGWIAGSYSISAALVSIFAARFIDRFDRRSVLLFSLTGLMVSTMAMVLANSLAQLIAVRALTGMFGGPVIASSMAVIADVFPEQRRGEAVGKVFGSFSIAAVLGVPLGLEIAHHFGWWAPFMAVSAVALATLLTIRLYLPPMRKHLEHGAAMASFRFSSLKGNTAAFLAVVMIITGLFGAFLIIPNISAHVQQNMHYPRDWLGLMYFVGGGAAFFSMRFAGKESDRIGYAKMSMVATIGLWLTLYAGFYAQWQEVPVLLTFILFMITMSTRNVTINALLSKIPKPQERAGFMSLISAVQHLMAGAGAAASTLMLTETPEHRLAGMDHVALLAMLSFGISAVVMFRIEKEVRARRKDSLVQAELAELSQL